MQINPLSLKFWDEEDDGLQVQSVEVVKIKWGESVLNSYGTHSWFAFDYLDECDPNPEHQILLEVSCRIRSSYHCYILTDGVSYAYIAASAAKCPSVRNNTYVQNDPHLSDRIIAEIRKFLAK